MITANAVLQDSENSHQAILATQDGYKFEAIYNIAGDASIFAYEVLASQHQSDWLSHDLRTVENISSLHRNIEGKIWINLSTESIVSIDDAAIEQAALDSPQFVIEWVEDRCKSEILYAAAEKLKFWRDQFSIKVALDDMGKGQDALERFLAIKPDYAKIDGSLIHKARHSNSHLRAIQWLCQWCNNEGVPTVWEWIENKQDLATALSCNAKYGQGFFFNNR